MSSSPLGVSMSHAMSEASSTEVTFPPFTRLVGKVTLLDKFFDEGRVLVECLTQWNIELSSFIMAIYIVA